MKKLKNLLLLSALLCAQASYAQPLPLNQIKLPSGFQISLVARIPSARQMVLGEGGTVFVGTKEDKVFALELDDKSRVKKVHEIAADLKLPIGVAYAKGNLYVSAVNRILRFDDIEKNLSQPPKPVVVRNDLPSDNHHGGKVMGFGPDGWLYVAVGVACNICEPDPNRYGVILRMKEDGSSSQVFARGIRNSVGFDWHPQTRELWFTDNGRDWMGKDYPPDELNYAPKANMHFGFPYCHAGTIADSEYGNKRACSEFTPPAQNLGPHVAALGMRFYSGTQFPAPYRNRIFIAEHGSWNRIDKIGYRITMVTLDGNRAVAYETFASGWLQGQKAWGRPVDVLVLPNGSMLVSDDHAGAIYRIDYRAPAR